MNSSDKPGDVTLRRTFAIISHPDAGKTTLTEQFLHYGGAIQLAGTVRARKSGRYVTSDWMKLEKERGISVTSSVMQFLYQDYVVNLLDTPGHADFSEDTYRTLTAVDSALMVVDLAKGVEQRTIKLMEVCRLRDTPIMTFVNKLDREGRDPMEVMDEIESVLGIRCAPMTWPIGTGRQFSGIYRIYDDSIHLFARRGGGKEMLSEERMINGLENSELDEAIASDAATLREEIELIRGASHEFDVDAYRSGTLTPVYIGSALNGEGTQELIDSFVQYAPAPGSRRSIPPSRYHRCRHGGKDLPGAAAELPRREPCWYPRRNRVHRDPSCRLQALQPRLPAPHPHQTRNCTYFPSREDWSRGVPPKNSSTRSARSRRAPLSMASC